MPSCSLYNIGERYHGVGIDQVFVVPPGSELIRIQVLGSEMPIPRKMTAEDSILSKWKWSLSALFLTVEYVILRLPMVRDSNGQ